MTSSRVTALILAGGNLGDYGVLTEHRPKGALTFAGNYRIIDFPLSSLRQAGIHAVGLIIQYLPASLIEHVGMGQPWDLYGLGRNLKIMPPFVGVRDTNWYKGTADAVWQNLNFLDSTDNEQTIVLSGEHVYRLDFQAVLAEHRRRGAELTIVTKELPEAMLSSRFGYVQSDEDGRVTKYLEKPAAPLGNRVSMGIYVFETAALRRVLAEDAANAAGGNLAVDVLQGRAADMRTYEFVSQDFWAYLGDLEEYYEVHMRLLRSGLLEEMRGWSTLTNLEYRNIGSQPPTRFAAGSRCENSLISPGCVIEGEVRGSILSPGVRVAAGAQVIDSILMHDCVVEAGAVVRRTVSDKDAVFTAGTSTGAQTGRPTVIAKGQRMGQATVAA